MDKRMYRHIPRLALPALVALTALGCGTGAVGVANRPSTAKVEGVVTYKGAPIEGAIVTFRSANDSPSAFATTNAKGKYKLTTFEAADGALPGEYQVTVKKTEVTGGNELPEDHPDYGKQPIVESISKDVLPAKYGDPATSGLTASITDGKNSITFDLED